MSGKNNDELIKHSYGIFNLRKTGSIALTALQAFKNSNSGVDLRNRPTGIEAELCRMTTAGAIMFCEPCENVEVFEKDVKAFYPSIMLKNKFPISEGEFYKLTKDDDLTQYGFYRGCAFDIPEENLKLYRAGKGDWLTHADIAIINGIGGRFVLIEDERPNAYLYEEKALKSGKILFGSFFHLCFGMEKTNERCGKIVKKIRNSLWGALCQINKRYTDINTPSKENKIENDGEILSVKLTTTRDGKTNYKIVRSNSGDIYGKNALMPRIAPFLLAFGRQTIGNIVLSYRRRHYRVVRCHTDGVYLVATEKSGLVKKNSRVRYAGDLTDKQEGVITIKNMASVLKK